MMNGGIDPQMLAMLLRGGGAGGRTYNPGGGARLTPQIGAGGYVTPETAQRMALAEGLSGRRRPPIHSTAQFGAELGQDALAAAMAYSAKSKAEEDGKTRASLLAEALRVGAGRPAETRDGYADPDTGEGFKIAWNSVAPNRGKTIDMLTSNPLTTDLGVGMMQADDEARRKREALLLEKGFELDPATGGMRPIKGGYADPGYLYATKEAESGAGAAADAWKKAQEPHVVPEGGKLVVPTGGAYGPGTAPPGSPQRSGLMGETPPPGGWSGGTKTVMREPIGVRNNNPGNIKQSPATWDGAVDGGEGGFVKFDTPESGVAAMGRNLLTYQDKHGLNTVGGIINRWAPPSENDSAGYAAIVAKRLGVSPDQEIDLRNPATMQGMIEAMIKVENGKAPYGRDVIGSGVLRALDGGGAPSRRLTQVASAETGTATDAAPAATGGYQVVLDNQKERTPKPQSDIGKLYADRDAMPEGDPRRAAFDEAIRKHAGQELSPGDRTAVMETEDKASSAASAIASLRKARELNDRAYSGPIASRAAPLVAGLPGAHPDAEATIEYQNLIAGQALEQMKAVFGANPTEGERTAMIELQASVDKPPAVRARMIDAAMKKLEAKHGEMTARAEALRKQTYFEPGAATRQVAPPATAPVDDPLGIR
jgi:hypothetical protein